MTVDVMGCDLMGYGMVMGLYIFLSVIVVSITWIVVELIRAAWSEAWFNHRRWKVKNGYSTYKKVQQ